MEQRPQRRGLKSPKGVRQPFTEFRTSFTSPEGFSRTDVFFGRVVNVDMVNWTVDVFSQFDQMRLLEIPVSSPYQHHNRGDGIYVMPEVNSKCAVCWPSDSSPPFVLGFIMSHESNTLAASDTSPDGTGGRSDRNLAPTAADFSGGRPRSKPGDIIMRGRDGNQVILHRGGVLQIGANELSQRMYIPLGNLIMDFAENYALQSAGGSINWGIQEGDGIDGLPTSHVGSYRVYANDKYADIRVSKGKVTQPVPETDNDMAVDLTLLDIAQDSPIVYEVALVTGGFKAESGNLVEGAQSAVKLRFFFDREGGAALKAEGSLLVRTNKKFRLRAEDDIDIYGKGSFFVDVDGDMRLLAGGIMNVGGATTVLGGGSKPVAREGDSVIVPLPPDIMVTGGGTLGSSGRAGTTGFITGGAKKVLA